MQYISESKSPLASISHPLESLSSSDQTSSNQGTFHEYNEPIISPNSNNETMERIQSLKKMSHFSETKRSSDSHLSMNFLKIDNLKGDDHEQIAIDLPTSSTNIKPSELLFTEEQTKAAVRGNKRELTLKTHRNNYFVSENSFEGESLKIGEIIENDINFNYKVFFEFFFMHLLFYVFLGPLSAFVIALIWGWGLARNQFFWGWNFEFCTQTFEFFLIFFLIFPCYFYSFPNIYMIEIYMILAALVLRISIISIKYATMSDDKIKLLKTKTIPEHELKNEFTLRNFFKQIDEVELEKELQTTIMRKDLDVALLLFRFLSDVNKEIEVQIQSDYNPFNLESEKYDQDQKTENKSGTPSQKPSIISVPSLNSANGGGTPGKRNSKLISSTNTFLNSSKVGKRMNLYADFISDDDMKTTVYSGYLLAKLILKKGYKGTIELKWYFVLSLIVSAIHALLPSFYRFYDKGCFLSDGLIESLVIIGTILVNFHLFLVNLTFLFFGIYEFNRQVGTLNQLSNLMSCKKIASLSEEKFTPTIDFFCKLSLKSWGSLHKIIRSFGAKYKLRVECYLTLFSLFYLVVTILIVSAIFGNLQTLYTFVNLVVLIFEVIIISLCMIALISIGVNINKQYQIHKGLIKTNKDVLSDLLRLYVVYFEKKEYKPENEVYRKGVEKVLQKVNYYLTNNIEICNPKKWMHDEMKKKVTKRILKDLISICDEIIEELTFENMYEPFRINGIAATPKVLQGILAIFGSLLFAVAQRYIDNLMSK